MLSAVNRAAPVKAFDCDGPPLFNFVSLRGSSL
jgi:hypothetical protein